MLRSMICMLGLVATLAQAQEAPPQSAAPATAPPGEATVITTAYGTTFDAYVNGPADAGKAVLLLPDRYGLNKQAQDWTDRFAAQGYRALTIDLYDGRRGNDWKHATSVMHSIDQVWADSDIAAALDYLKKDHPNRKVVVLGWDYGATQAMAATLHDPAGVAATVAYYPTRLETDAAVVQTLVHPVLIVVAERDQELSTDEVLAFKDGLSKTRVEFNVMGLDADRAFCDPANSHYDPAATATVWDVTQEFLTRYLGP